MVRKLNPQGIISQESFLFASHAQYRDKVFPKFVEVAKRNNLSCRIEQEVYKSGGLIGGTKDVLLTIDGGYVPFCVIGCTTFGDFLSVDFYFLTEDNMLNKMAAGALKMELKNLGYFAKDMLNVRDMNAFYNSVHACLMQCFAELTFQEFKSGFLGIQ